ncbi:MAG: HEAT repeat domain-containing protein [Chthonomonadaceae bacterium]|nr:HEAT repeat domain-containing protein [Chthonomonadaceae bacterium]
MASAWVQTPAPQVEVDGWSYPLSPQGALLGKSFGGGAWDEVASLHRAAEERLKTAPTWRVKVVILSRADIVERGADGVARLRRGVLRVDDLERVQAEIARFAVVAEARAGGAMQLAFDVEVDDAPASVESTDDPYGRAFLDSTLAPLLNGAVFDPSDPKYRGPYDSAFLLHPALVRTGVNDVILGTSASSIPVQAYSQPGQLALAMADAWATHLARRVRDLGFPLTIDQPAPSAFDTSGEPTAVRRPDAFMAPDLWRVACERFAPTPAYQAHATRDLPAHTPWSVARENPYRLPRLDDETLAALAGAPMAIAADGDRIAFAATGQAAATFDPSSGATALLSLADKRLLFVDWAQADLFGSHLDPRLKPQVEGWLEKGDRLFVVFSLAPGPSEPEINLLRLEGLSVQATPVPRGTPPQLELPPGGRTASGPGDLVRIVAADGKQRWAAHPWIDPVRVDLPSSLLLAGESVSVVAQASASSSPVQVRWEVPPGWQAPADGVLKEGQNAWAFTVPRGALDQEVRCTFSQASSGWTRVATIRVERLATPLGLELVWGPGTVPAVSGGFSVAPTAEGEGVLVTEAPGSRAGRVLLLRRQGSRPVLNVATHPFLELTLDGSKAEPLDLVVREVGGRVTRVRLFDVPGALGAEPPTWSVPTIGPGAATLDLRAAGVSGAVEEVRIETPEAAGLYERPLGASSFVLKRVRVLSAPEGAVVPIGKGTPLVADAAGTLWQRAAAAARTPNAALLGDARDLVALNAASAARRAKFPDLVPELGALVRSLEKNVVHEAIEALAFQDTPAAWALVTGALDAGPSDEARESAARVLGREGRIVAAAPLTSMIIALSWRARATGAEALASLPGSEPAQLALVFLQDVHPAVRLAVVRHAKMDVDPVARRIQFESVNDPSDQVRYESYLALIRSTLPGMADEGYRGVRDDSPAVRIALLEAFRLLSAKEARGALRLAVVDTDPRVRAAALSAFATAPGDVALDELGGVLEEKDARIQAALVELAVAKKLALPPKTLEALASSTDPSVARWARERQP